MRNRILHTALLTLLALGASSCRNKDLCYEDHGNLGGDFHDMNVVIHWQDEVAKPAKGMMVNLFGVNGTPHYGMEHYPVEGGPVRLEAGGEHHGLCYDYYAENIYFRNEYVYEHIEAYCAPMTRATYSRTYPDEVTVSEPDFPFWVDKTENFVVDGKDMHFYPDNVVEVYTFEIRGIEGAEYISACRGGVGGMSDLYCLSDGTLSQSPSTVLFTAKKNGANDTITGSFRTFGYVNTPGNTNNFTIEILFPSKTNGIINARWDVTDQVISALHIDGIPDIIIENKGEIPPIVPDDDDQGSGFEADVDEWDDVTVPIPMQTN